MIAQKKCKGQGKAKSVKGCGKMVDVKYRRYGLCTSCYADFILNTDYGRILLEKATLKATKPRRDLEKAEKESKSRNTLGQEIQKTQRLFNNYIRLRDKGKPCISSLIAYKDDFDAGHCFSVKQYPSLRFDFDNVHGQSVNANRFLDGDHENYLINLPNRIGQERFNALLKRAAESKKTIRKYSVLELQELQKEIKQKLKEL